MNGNIENMNKIIENRNNIDNDTIDKRNYLYSQNQEKLSLRKNKITDVLLSKRKMKFQDHPIIKQNTKLINLSQLQDVPNEISKDPNLYIKTQFDPKKWFKFLFSKNTNSIKLSLFLIRRFIDLQIEEIEFENRKLSRNDTELINQLCKYLLHEDAQIVYEACWCLTNLTLFPTHIEKRIYTENNLNIILQFFSRMLKDNQYFDNESLYLFVNINTSEKVREFFLSNSIFLENLYNLMQNILNETQKNTDIAKTLIRILNNNILILQTNKENLKKYYIVFIPLCKSFTKIFYLDEKNIKEDDYQYILSLFYNYTKLIDIEIIKEILSNNFTNILIDLYNKMNQNDNKIQLMKIFCDFSSFDDAITQILINDGIIQLFSNEIKRLFCSNLELMTLITFACSNIGHGNLNQCDLLYDSEIIPQLIDISIILLDNYNKNVDLLINMIGTIAEDLLGCSEKTKPKFISYKNAIVIDIFSKAIKNNLDPNFKTKLLSKICFSIQELNVLSEELEKNQESIYIQRLIESSLEDILSAVLNNNKNLESVITDIINDIIDFIRDKVKNFI